MPKLILCACLLACSADRAASPEPVPAAAPLPGVVAPRASEIVAAPIDGRITRVVVRSGQRVHTGDLIAELDAAPLAERLRVATAAVVAARARVAAAREKVAAAQHVAAAEDRLFALSVTSAKALQVARTNLSRAIAAADRAAAEAREADASRAALEAQLSHTSITSPIDGVVSTVNAQTGEIVAPGTLIVRVFDPTNLMVRFQVPRDRRREMIAGTTVELTVENADQPLRATVTSVSTSLELPLDFAVAEADITDVAAAGNVEVGMLGDVRLVIAK